MADNLMIEATGRDFERLLRVFELAPWTKYEGVGEMKAGMLEFHYTRRTLTDEGFPFPMPLSAKLCAQIASEWLQARDRNFGEQPDIDGDCKQGWRITASRMSNMLIVAPIWMIYHK